MITKPMKFVLIVEFSIGLSSWVWAFIDIRMMFTALTIMWMLHTVFIALCMMKAWKILNR